MIPFNPQKLLAYLPRADTDELLDRLTVEREGMEPEAVPLIEAELARRGLGPEEIRKHARELEHRVIRHRDGLPLRCALCSRVAVERRTGWHRLWGVLPIFKRTFYYCERHRE